MGPLLVITGILLVLFGSDEAGLIAGAIYIATGILYDQIGDLIKAVKKT